MNKKRIISLVLLVVGIVLLIIGLFNMFKPSSNLAENEQKEEEKIDLELAGVIENANQLYGGEGKKIKVEDEEDRYVIYVSASSTNKVLNTFYMDKETGIISEKPVSMKQSVTG